MFQSIKIDVDSKDFYHKLDLLDKKRNFIAKRMMGKVLTEVKKDSKKNLSGSVLDRQTGTLFKSITYKTRNDFTGYIRSATPYSAIHEFGGVIRPKNSTFLAFQSKDGQWVRTKEARINATPYLRPVIDEYFSSSKADSIMDDVLQRALDELFGVI